MKKTIIRVFITAMLTISSFLNCPFMTTDKAMAYPNSVSNEKLYQYTIQSFLYLYIDKAIENYYGHPFSHDPWDDKILSIDGAENLTNFVIKLEVKPYYGPHRTVGIDHITISINAVGDVMVEKFEHIKTLLDIHPKPARP